MYTPKSRKGSSGAPQKGSPRSVSFEPTTQKGLPQSGGSSEPPQKASPRVARQLKTTGPRYFEHTASSLNLTTKPPKERNPKVSDRRSPKSPASETKRQNRVSELESQVSQLENDLSLVKVQLSAIEASKKQAEKDAEEANQRASALSLKLEESQKRFSESLALGAEEISQEQSHALDEIAQLKHQLETMAESDAKHTENFEAAKAEVSRLKEALSENELLVEETKSQLEESKVSEAKNQASFEEALLQVENAKKTMDVLRSDSAKAKEGYEDLASELGKYRARVDYLEGLVGELKAQIEVKEGTEIESTDSTKLEIQQLRYALEAAEIRYNEERARSKEQMTKAFEAMDNVKSESHRREAELENWLQTSKDRIEELKSKLMDKENEVQGMSEENDALNKKLEATATLKSSREEHLAHELNKSRADFDHLRTLLMDKENEFQNTLEENEALKLQVKELITADKKGGEDIEASTDIESIRASEREALMKVGYLMEEVDKSNRRVARMKEELEAAQSTNSEVEAELRRIKVQSDQWRKAAEAAAAMISAAGNNGQQQQQQQQLVERTGSMDSHYNNSPRMKMSGGGGGGSPYGYELDEDSGKKKNANVLKRFWKKNQK